jgi:hypothetical protein
MLLQEATPEMVEAWKEVWQKYKSRLLPNRKSGREVVEYLKKILRQTPVNFNNSQESFFRKTSKVRKIINNGVLF